MPTGRPRTPVRPAASGAPGGTQPLPGEPPSVQIPGYVNQARLLDGGLLTTVQDLGRYGYQRYGVPVAGAMDVLATNAGDSPNLYRNDGNHASNWLRLRTVGTKSNRDGIGAQVEVVAGSHRQRRERIAVATLCQDDEVSHHRSLCAATS